MAQVLLKCRLLMHSSRVIQQNRSFMNSFCLRNKKVPEEAIPKNLLHDYFSSHQQSPGDIYDKRPFKMKLQAKKKYAWCSCGHSKSQPLCDGTHKIHTFGIKNKPIFFAVEETKEYWLCNCKNSDHKPFCDGTHLNDEIQTSMKHFKT